MNIVIKKLILLIEINLFTPELNIIYKFILFYFIELWSFWHQFEFNRMEWNGGGKTKR